jgi:uncharacterized protein YndB with AHSA1/START domain
VTPVHARTEIAASAEVVWALVSDITRMGEWSQESTGGTWRGGATGPALGARFTGTNANGRRHWTTACEVTACDPGRAFGFRVRAAGLKVARWDYRITPTDAGCAVTETWTDDRGAVMTFLGRLVTGVADREAHNRAGMKQTLAELKSVAESGA